MAKGKTAVKKTTKAGLRAGAATGKDLSRAIVKSDVLPDNVFRPVIKAFLESNGLTQANIDSFNRLIEYDLAGILQSHMPIVARIPMPDNSAYSMLRIEKYLFDPRVSPPTHRDTGDIMPPITAFNEKHHYSSDVLVHHRNLIYGINAKGETLLSETTTQEPRRFTRFPMMLRSQGCYTGMIRNDHAALRAMSEDPYEFGGFFIIDSKEYVVISQDEKGSNMAYINYRKPPKDTYECSVKSRGPGMVYTDTPANFKITLNNKNILEVTLNLWNSVPIPIILLFQALGVVTDRRIAEFMIGDTTQNNNAHGNNANRMAHLLGGSFAAYISRYGPTRANPDQGDEDSYLRRGPDETLEFWALHTLKGMVNSKKRYRQEQDRISMVQEMRRQIAKDLLPHLGDDNLRKAIYIGYQVNRLFKARLGLLKEDDPYNYGNRRVNTPGILFGMVFEQTIRIYDTEFRKRLLNDIKENPNLKITDIAKMLDDYNVTDKIENNINSTLRNGSWNLGSAYYKSSKSKISMMMDRKSRMDPLAMCRKVSTGVSKGNTSNMTRQLHQSVKGKLCMAETPEGGNIGLFKHFALTGYVTVNNPLETEKAVALLREIASGERSENGKKGGKGAVSLWDVKEIEPSQHDLYTRVFLNGDLCYLSADPIGLRDEIVEARRRMDLTFASVSYNYTTRELYIYTDHGRVLQPLYVVDENNRIKMTPEMMKRLGDGELSWYDLLRLKVVEYIGIHEEQWNCVVAIWPSDLRNKDTGAPLDPRLKRYTHCEIHPSTWLGTSAGLVPFSGSNPSPRLVFQCAMGKQAMDIYNVNFHNRFDTFVHVMPMIQRPLVTTYFSDLVHYNKLPSGRNALVAIMCYGGYNMEDSVMLNKDFVDRWGFTSINYKTINVDLSSARQQHVAKPNPKKTRGFKKTNSYDVIGEKTGLPIIGKVIRKGDIVVGMVQKISSGSKDEFEYTDKSIEYNEFTPGVIDSVLTSQVHNDSQFVKIRTRTIKPVMPGDKFSSRKGQKGTTGLIYPTELFPFVDGGIIGEDGKVVGGVMAGAVPDIIMNPHAFPSRMTVGQNLEGLASLVAGLLGIQIDATLFTDTDLESFFRELERLGVNRHGNFRMRCGGDGEPIAVEIFQTPVYYQRLKHIVDGKLYVRSIGARQKSTRQPLAGKNRGGGVRLGLMERDVLVAHGASLIIREKFLLNSDPYSLHVCQDCGFFAPGNTIQRHYTCLRCKKSNRIAQVVMPYATKRFIQEIMTLTIPTRLILG